MWWCFLQWTNQPMPHLPTLEECTDDKQECSNIQNSPEKASTKYRGSLTLRSPHTRRNRWTGPEPAGMPGKWLQKSATEAGPELNTPNCSSESTDNGKSTKEWIMNNSHYSPFPALHQSQIEDVHHSQGTGVYFQRQAMCRTCRKLWCCSWTPEPPLGPELNSSRWSSMLLPLRLKKFFLIPNLILPSTTWCFSPMNISYWDVVNELGSCFVRNT